jgi:hypothetical protein
VPQQGYLLLVHPAVLLAKHDQAAKLALVELSLCLQPFPNQAGSVCKASSSMISTATMTSSSSSTRLAVLGGLGAAV